MGNSQAAATLAVHIDSPAIFPGALVTGRVYLMVNSERVSAETLLLRIVGGEYSSVNYTTSDGEHTHHHTAHSTSIFLDLSVALANPNGGYFLKGQYEFPFRFGLPLGVLPSMGAAISGGDGGKCSVSYAIEVKLHRRGWFKWDVQTNKEFWVLGPPAAHLPNFPTYIPPIEHPLNFFGCCNRGNVRLGISTEKSVLAAGEGFDVNYVIQNNSTSRVKAMEITVVENVTWRAQGHTSILSTNLFHRRLEANELQVEMTADLVPSVESVGYTGVITNHDVLLHLKNILDSKQFRCPVFIAAHARTTMDGQLIDVEHFLKIAVKTPFGTSDPEIFSKLIIHRYGIQTTPYAVATAYPMPQQPSAVQQLPSNWQGQTSAPVDIPVPKYAPPMVVNAAANDVPYNPEAQGMVMANQSQFPQQQPPPEQQQQQQYPGGVPQLLASLQQTFTPVDEFQRWCEINPADSLTPNDLIQIYTIIKRIVEQLSITEHLKNARSFLLCEHLTAILSRANDSIKVEIIRLLAPKIQDKQNVAMIRQCVSAYQFLCVEQYFKE